jgi:hypothetical protein
MRGRRAQAGLPAPVQAPKHAWCMGMADWRTEDTMRLPSPHESTCCAAGRSRGGGGFPPGLHLRRRRLLAPTRAHTAGSTTTARRPATAHRPAQPMMSYDDYDPVQNHMQSFNCPRSRTINWKGSPPLDEPACISHAPWEKPWNSSIKKNGSLIV